MADQIEIDYLAAIEIALDRGDEGEAYALSSWLAQYKTLHKEGKQ